MKTIKNIFEFLFEKIPVITISSLMLWLMKYLLEGMIIGNYSDYQIMLSTMSIVMCVISFLLVWKMVPSKTWKIVNLISAILIAFGGVLIGQDYKGRPNHYRDYVGEYSITQSNKTTFVETKYCVFTCDNSKVKSDSLNPLKAYDVYKIDMFGDTTPPSLALKSNLMKDYIYPTFTRK